MRAAARADGGGLSVVMSEMAPRAAIAPRVLCLMLSLIVLASVKSMAQTPTDMVIDKFSVHGTLPFVDGRRQVTASCRVINTSAARTRASTATVQFAGVSRVLNIPALDPGATAYVSSTISISGTRFFVSVTLDNGASASYDFDTTVPAVGRWRPIGPTAIVTPTGAAVGVGRITTVAIDPSSPSTVYVGARATGVWKTSDGGAHWEPLTDALPTLNIVALAVDSTRPSYVYLAAAQGFYLSTDGGHVWTLRNSDDLQPQGSDGGALIVRRLIPLVFAGPSLVAAKTTDGTSAAAPDSSLALPLALPGSIAAFNQVRLYLSTRKGLRVSQDGGVTWDAAVVGPNSAIPSLAQDFNNRDHFLATAVGPEAGVYETLNGGLSAGNWIKLQGCADAPLPAFASNVGIWVAMSGTRKWVSVKNGGSHDLWRTTGETCKVNGRNEQGWELVSSGSSTPCIGSTSAWSYLVGDPRNSNILYKGGIALCRSTDGGGSFQPVHGVHVDHHAIAFHPGIAGLMYIGNDGGFYRSDDGGASFAFVSSGMQITEFLETDAGGAPPWNVIGGSQDNGLEGGDEVTPAWRGINLGADPDGDRSLAVTDPLDGTVQYSVGQAIDHFSRTVDGTRDEGFDYSGMPTGCLTYSETPSLSNQFIATTSPDFHLVTTVGPSSTNGPNCNGGLWTGPPWHPVFAPGGAEALVRVTHDASNGLFLAGGNMGSIYINFSPEVMAKVWTAPGQPYVTSIAPDPALVGHYFVAVQTTDNVGAGRLFEIHSDGPLHFVGEDITSNLPDGVIMTIAPNPFEPNVLYAGTRGKGAIRGVRDVGGTWTWQSFNFGMPEGALVTKLKVNPVTGVIYAGTFGRGAFALDTISFY